MTSRRSTFAVTFAIALAASVVMILLVGSGVFAGFYLATHYALVPKDQAQPMQAVAPAEISVKSPTGSDSALNPFSSPAPAVPATPAANPFGFRFRPQERLEYRLSSQVTGQGFESIGPSDVKLGMSGDISMVTDTVDGTGNANLTISYDRMLVNGDFMGSSYTLDKSPGRTIVNLNGETTVDTADPRRPSKGVAPLEFLEDPLKVKVAPNGQVLQVSGGAGWGDQLKEIPVVLPLELPDMELRNGLQWDSFFTFPLPGAGAPIKAHAKNTVVGTQYIGKRLCTVIRQDLTSEAKDGQLNSPDSVFGKEMSFSMPLFDLSGTNYIYFDTQRGQLVHNTSDLKLTMKIGSALDKVGDSLQEALGQLSAILGQGQAPSNPSTGANTPEMQGLDLVLDIDSTMTLNAPDVAAIPPLPQPPGVS